MRKTSEKQSTSFNNLTFIQNIEFSDKSSDHFESKIHEGSDSYLSRPTDNIEAIRIHVSGMMTNIKKLDSSYQSYVQSCTDAQRESKVSSPIIISPAKSQLQENLDPKLNTKSLFN